eukprot:TRINITY_DN26181_c0_g1_i4.p2 TRINITY_DN26181_c0_g1~~TRINITY_DN26181_c0_g1_i4.p2  ORF type:complete len:113 (-),score=16.55 TRINITY_DN26181_c0_g1_i4:161-499(-)
MNMETQLTKRTREIVDVFMDDSEDLLYKFEIIAEFHKLSEGEHSLVLSDISQIYMKLSTAIESHELVVPIFDMYKKYDSAEVDEYYEKLLKIAVMKRYVTIEEPLLLSLIHI